MTAAIEARLRQARLLAAAGDYRAAQDCYVHLLRDEPRNVDALVELGAVAHAGGYRSAARTVFRQAVAIDAGNTVAHLGLGSLLYDAGELAGAEHHYRAALASDPTQPVAHQGLARVLLALGDPAAEAHFRAGFCGHAIVRQPYFGQSPGIPLLMLVSARGGNLHTRQWIDDRSYAVTAVYADFHDPLAPLPPHALVLNAIGDADLCGDALDAAERLVARCEAPVLNQPAQVRQTTRIGNAEVLGGLPNVITPRMMRLARADMARAACLGFPLLLRAPGFHTGQFFVRVDRPEDLAAAAATLPTGDVLAMSFLDARGVDGMARKYRVMFIDGELFPLHLAIAPDWKVHYFSAAMAGDAGFRLEERRFLTDVEGVLGQKGLAALAAIQARLGLDYAGIDFGLSLDGDVLFFEANATMIIAPPDANPVWDYRRPAIGCALAACRRMLQRRISRAA